MARANGFTLIEVLVALTILGLSMGGCLSLLSQNKKLAFRALNVLDQNRQIRAVLNAYQFDQDKIELFPLGQLGKIAVQVNGPLPAPIRQTKQILYVLEQYEVDNQAGRTFLGSVRWKKLEAPK